MRALPRGQVGAVQGAQVQQGRKYNGQARALALLMFPAAEGVMAAGGEAARRAADRAFASYRKLVAGCNRRLDTIEVKMCGGDWASIKPGQVPGCALKKFRRAFLNEPVLAEGEAREARFAEAIYFAGEEKEEAKAKAQKAQRFPDREDRVACAETFRAHLVAGKEVKGKVLHCHELVGEYYSGAYSYGGGGDDDGEAPDLVIEAVELVNESYRPVQPDRG